MADGLTHGMYQTLMEIFEGTPYQDRFSSAEDILGTLRGRKTAAEVERIRAAIRTTEEIYQQTFDFIQPGMTEREVSTFMHEQMEERKLGPAWSLEGCPIVNAGPRFAGRPRRTGGYPHPARADPPPGFWRPAGWLLFRYPAGSLLSAPRRNHPTRGSNARV